ncbi:MAG: mono/diheme cytochrome c family protein [Myxococcota bacterium]|jgi:mono/diheme cytochrome c family protein
MLLLLFACIADPTGTLGDTAPATETPLASSRSESTPSGTTTAPTELGLPVIWSHDPVAAERGGQLLLDGVGRPLIPRVALRSLWAVWGGPPILDDGRYWEAFRDRYGLAESPWPNDDYPVGLHAEGPEFAALDCLACHTDVVAGTLVVGAGSSRFDLQALIDDLIALGDVGEDLGLPPVVLPWAITDRTTAAGATDATGLGFELSLLYGPPGADIETVFGPQQPPAWWTLAYKRSAFVDGSGAADGHRTMAAMLLAFGLTWPELMAMDAELEEMHQFLLSLRAPSWPFDPPDPAAVASGRAVFDATCAGCHGVHTGPDAAFPDTVVDVGTDPLRHTAFGPEEAAWMNAGWFGETHPVSDTEGYLAPPLLGVWATAPYFHAGSVPTLAAVLDPDARPAAWQRTGAEADDYDPVAVGWRHTVESTGAPMDTVEGRRIVDTTRAGLSAAGHRFGEDLSTDERTELLAYLMTL